MEKTTSRLLQERLLQHFLPRTFITVKEAGEVLGYDKRTTYNLRAKGKFPVPVRQINGRFKVHLTHLLDFIDSAATNKSPVGSRQRGRPKKAEYLEQKSAK